MQLLPAVRHAGRHGDSAHDPGRHPHARPRPRHHSPAGGDGGRRRVNQSRDFPHRHPNTQRVRRRLLVGACRARCHQALGGGGLPARRVAGEGLLPILSFSRDGSFRQVLFELLYFFGLGGAMQALFTPDIRHGVRGRPVPVRAHVEVVGPVRGRDDRGEDGSVRAEPAAAPPAAQRGGQLLHDGLPGSDRVGHRRVCEHLRPGAAPTR